VQSLILAVPPAASSPLQSRLEQIITLMNDGAMSWPGAAPTAPSLDHALVLRRLRAAGAWAGPCRAGVYRAGDGESTVTVELEGQFARLILAVAVDRAGGALQQADVMLGS
jgi:hypothetical protein